MTDAIAARELFRVHRTAEGDAAALQGLSLRVAPGERIVVLGPSGAGKTTLLRVLAGLEPPSAGSVEVLGADLGRLPARRRAAFRQDHVGLVDQHHDRALPPALRCADVVGLPLALRGAPRPQRTARAGELLERVGLGDRARARPHELSGGERQRLAVCAAVAHRPGLLLADEPGGELDAASAQAVYALIAELARDEGTTVVMVSHDPAAAETADRTLRLRDGRITGEAAGSAAEEAIVVGRGGWVRLPDELLREAGVGGRLLARARPGTVELRAAPDSAPGAHPEPLPPVPAARAAARPRRPGLTAVLRAVDKAYGERAVLAAFDARFTAGRLTALSGRSGSGKSTILRLLAGLERPDAGTILVGAEDLAGRSRTELAAFRRDHVALVAQDVGLVDFLSAQENVAFALAQRGVAEDEAERRAHTWLTEVGLAERTRQRVGRLSGGERQRVALARALAAEPGLLLADEPTSRLDEANAAAVAQLLAAIAERHGTTIVCATHEPLLIAHAHEQVAL
ncbi:ATP-binding cassette domain-containing protein [Capillimicrobium parvum]|uniref:Vitamin B12 import ATP-binding protein BtuD n=1 Tax=Capillimicrobium parvum TaxID=2884022 RepID=A0A9E6Y0G7_9ACTN|nr:ATP-binding cassette domain-containing protein [Capillimicrobium parvum]UGS37403.1 Vitamin B12 import ATP-binding protein BtuD [Capillimicrobium parvum]